MIKDPRINENLATQYIESSDNMVFRKVLQNGSVVEHRIDKLRNPDNINDPLYRDQKYTYAPKKKDNVSDDPTDFDRRKYRISRKDENHFYRSTIQSLLVSLIDMNYTYID